MFCPAARPQSNLPKCFPPSPTPFPPIFFSFFVFLSCLHSRTLFMVQPRMQPLPCSPVKALVAGCVHQCIRLRGPQPQSGPPGSSHPDTAIHSPTPDHSHPASATLHGFTCPLLTASKVHTKGIFPHRMSQTGTSRPSPPDLVDKRRWHGYGRKDSSQRIHNLPGPPSTEPLHASHSLARAAALRTHAPALSLQQPCRGQDLMPQSALRRLQTQRHDSVSGDTTPCCPPAFNPSLDQPQPSLSRCRTCFAEAPTTAPHTQHCRRPGIPASAIDMTTCTYSTFPRTLVLCLVLRSYQPFHVNHPACPYPLMTMLHTSRCISVTWSRPGHNNVLLANYGYFPSASQNRHATSRPFATINFVVTRCAIPLGRCSMFPVAVLFACQLPTAGCSVFVT